MQGRLAIAHEFEAILKDFLEERFKHEDKDINHHIMLPQVTENDDSCNYNDVFSLTLAL
jgi:hypothetical protein